MDNICLSCALLLGVAYGPDKAIVSSLSGPCRPKISSISELNAFAHICHHLGAEGAASALVDRVPPVLGVQTG